MGSSGGIKRQKSVRLGPMVLLQIKPKKKEKKIKFNISILMIP